MKEDKPIIKSALENDFYKFTMGQLIFEKYKEAPVESALKNRTTDILIADMVDLGELREQLDEVKMKRFNRTDLFFLRGINVYGDRMFKEEYLKFLENFRFPGYSITTINGQYKLDFDGKWSEQTYWEIPALAIVNELYYRSLIKKKNLTRFAKDLIDVNGKSRLAEKIQILKTNPDITFCDFGLRRRFNGMWQEYIDEVLMEEVPKQFLGTSNTYLAFKLGLLPMGTSAHELFMGLSGIMHNDETTIKASHNQVLRDWWDLYGYGLSVVPTDTYGTDFFFEDMTEEQARLWKGLRHDSGDPIVFGEKAIIFYKKFGIDPLEKLLVFSDGLDIVAIVKIYNHFKGRIKTTFGWGTNLTNDMGFKALSLVIKLVRSCGHGTVKFSDNLAKAIGEPKDKELFKKIFGYVGNDYEECKY